MDILLFVLVGILLYYLYQERKKNNTKNNDKNTYIKDSIDNDYPYKKVLSLLSKAEQNFFLVLSMAIQDSNYYICPKVRLADIIEVDTKDNYQVYFNKIRSKHIDYVLVDKITFNIKYALELDDISHNKNNRVLRDDFILNALSNAGIELIRFKVNYSYKVSEIREMLNIKELSS